MTYALRILGGRTPPLNPPLHTVMYECVKKRLEIPEPELGRSRKLKDRQYNAWSEEKRHNDLQNITQKTKDRATRTPLKTMIELRSSGRVGSCSTSATHRYTSCCKRDKS
jgi:hypothetical protein